MVGKMHQSNQQMPTRKGNCVNGFQLDLINSYFFVLFLFYTKISIKLVKYII